MGIHILSAIQFRPRFAKCRADVADNFRRLGPLVGVAQELGTSFLVFPELCLTGYSFMNREEALEVAEISDGPTFQKMRMMAQSLRSYISWGYVRIDELSGELFNSATMVNPSGSIIASYDKVNLWGNDFLWARPGECSAPVVETEFGRTSLVICRDLRDKIPGNLKNLERVASKGRPLFDGKSVDLVAACTNWGKGGFPSTTWMDFALDNKCTLVVANRWGEEQNESFEQDFGHGGSAIIQPDWKVHTNGLVFGQDCVVTAVIDPS